MTGGNKMVKVNLFQSKKHTFLDVKGKKIDIFRVFDTEKQARKHLAKLKKGKYWV